MKKILTLLSALSITMNIGISVVACVGSNNSNNDDNNMTVNKLKAEFKNNNLTISNDWNDFWGNLNNTLQNQTYYQLLMNQLFDQNKIQHKYEQDVQLQQQTPDGYVKAKNLSKISSTTHKSETNLQIQIHVNYHYTYIKFQINWNLTPDQIKIYPLINKLQKQNELSIYDPNISGYPKNQVQIKNYNQELKQAFNKQYNKGDNNYQYTNFTDSPLKNNYLHTDGTANHLNLVITYQKALYNVPVFIIYFYNIKQAFDVITKSYNSGFVLPSFWTNSDASKIPNEILQQLIGGIPGLDDLENYANQITFKGTLPKPPNPANGGQPSIFTVIQIIYTSKTNKQISAPIKTIYLEIKF